MNLKKTSLQALLSLSLICGLPILASSCANNSKNVDNQAQTDGQPDGEGPRGGGPQLGSVPKGGPIIDKSADSTLQAMIKTIVPEFKQFDYTDAQTGKTMKYNLFAPKNLDVTKKYPLVLFIADASTPGEDATRPLTQGYGALVWATSQSQAKNPCYVLVPQFSGVAVNDNYEHTDEVDMVIRLLADVTDNNPIDKNRLYTTGQSMGGMISMYYNVKYPDLFAASIFVDCHWDNGTFDSLVKHKFVYFIAGNEGKAYKCLEPIEEAARREGVQYTYAAWSAKLPEARQSELAATMLEKGAPVNLFEFESKTVLPDDGKGSEHMYSFDYAYRISSVRDWLFRQSK
ncbi:MAG: alpha/beta hydrolase-fold protein [Muribaculaceae bacterium]|nr:alpha/beta hydrolase-fold protein [Muribaculaceae bacterium]